MHMQWRFRRRGRTDPASAFLFVWEIEICVPGKSSLQVARTTLALFFNCCDLELWPVTLTYELVVGRVKMDHRAKCLGQRSFLSKIIVWTHTSSTRPLKWSVKTGCITRYQTNNIVHLLTSDLPCHIQNLNMPPCICTLMYMVFVSFICVCCVCSGNCW